VRWEELRWGEKSSRDLRWDENRREKLRWPEKRREQLWPAEKSWARERRHGMGWIEMRWKKLTRREVRWVAMRWDDTDCGDNGIRWEISKRSCDAMRSDEMRKGSTPKRHGIRLTSREIVAAKHRRLACHLQAQPLHRSIGYKRFKFETSAPGLLGYYL